MAIDVKGLLLLAILIFVLSSHFTPFSTSANPNPPFQTVFPLLLRSQTKPGEPVSS